MRNPALIILLWVAALSATAQDYNKFKVGFGWGLSNNNVLFLGYVQPTFMFSSHVGVGMRLEGALNVDEEYIGSTTLNGHYYFGSGKFQPFIGAGLGVYRIFFYSGDDSEFGYYPRLGFEWGMWTMMMDYNLLDVTQLKDYHTDPVTGVISYTTRPRDYSYFSVKLGAVIGAGRKTNSK